MVNLMQWQETLYKMFMEKDEGIMIKKETVTKTDLLKVLDLMEASGIQYWLDGGWGVDVLSGNRPGSTGMWISTLMPGAQTYCLTPWFPEVMKS